MRKILLSVTLSFLLGIFPALTFAWNAVGHMVVAQIAYDKLQPAVRAKVDKLVASLATEYPDIHGFTDIAPWPDQLRGQKIESYTHWHYIDKSFSTDGTPLKDLTDTDNAVWAIEQIEPVLKNEHANPYERARFLAFLVHIVGDIHQPLHTTSRISATYPDGDKGGNLFSVGHNLGRGKSSTNLHHIWDGGLGAFDDNRNGNIETLAQKITALYPEKYFGNLVTDLDEKDWATEGVKTATTFVYNTQEGQSPNGAYISQGQEIAKQKAALAGYRLAALLNKLLG